MAEVEQKKKRTFRKFTYRRVDLDQLLDMSYEQLMQLYSARQRLSRGLRRKQHSLKRLRKAKKDAPPMEKPEVVEDAPERHDHSARDGGQHGWRLQRQDLQPGGNQGACGMIWAWGWWGPATVPPLTIPQPFLCSLR